MWLHAFYGAFFFLSLASWTNLFEQLGIVFDKVFVLIAHLLCFPKAADLLETAYIKLFFKAVVSGHDAKWWQKFIDQHISVRDGEHGSIIRPMNELLIIGVLNHGIQAVDKPLGTLEL